MARTKHTLGDVATPDRAYQPNISQHDLVIGNHITVFGALTGPQVAYVAARAMGSPPHAAARTAGVKADALERFAQRSEEDPLIQEAIKLYINELNPFEAAHVTPNRIARILDDADRASGDSLDKVAVANAMMKLYKMLHPDPPKQRRKQLTQNDFDEMSDTDLAHAAGIPVSGKIIDLPD